MPAQEAVVFEDVRVNEPAIREIREAWPGGPLRRYLFSESADSSAVGRFDLKAGGSFYAIGRGGGLSGRGANLLILDDLLKDHEEAHSSTIRAGLHEWFASVAYPRLQPDGAIVYVATRWHADDLGGKLLREQGNEWVTISMPAVAETDETFRRAGEALWPERYPLPVLEEIKKSIGSAAFVSLYQQRPVASGGAVFKSAWFQTYRDIPPSFKKVLQSWDTVFQAKTTSDYSVCTTWASPNWLLSASRLA
jgi:hypothetical protein